MLRRKLLLSGVVLSALLCSSLVPLAGASMIWSRTYGGTGDDVANSLIATSDGGYALAGSTFSFGSGEYQQVSGGIPENFWLVKTDAVGNMLWNQTYGGTGPDWANSLVATSDGGYALVGIWNYSEYPQTNGRSPYQADVWLVKTDTLGNMEWNRTYGGPGNDWATSLVATVDGGYAFAGYTNLDGNEMEFTDAWLVKTDAFGNIEWNRTYDQGPYDSFSSLVTTLDGGYALTGNEFWLVKTDALGNMEWNQTYGENTGPRSAHALVGTPDGGYAIAGIREWGNSGYKNIQYSSVSWLFKTNSSGGLEWDRTIGEIPASLNTAWSLVATTDRGYVMAGDPLVKINSNGFVDWSDSYRETRNMARSVVQTADGGYIIAGTANSDADFWLAKTDALGFSPGFPPTPGLSPTPTSSSWFIPLLLATATSIALVAVLLFIFKRKRVPHKRSLQQADV